MKLYENSDRENDSDNDSSICDNLEEYKRRGDNDNNNDNYILIIFSAIHIQFRIVCVYVFS